jgi:hypothetical protein
MLSGQLIELAPKILVFNRLPIRGFPAALLPISEPLTNSATNIFRIGIHTDVTSTIQCGQTLNRGYELHSIIGRRNIAATKLFLGSVG